MDQSRYIFKTEQKALEINLDKNVYGTFAEIGAGQEVARIFFQVGAAAGTIAKSMSAYDKTYSDAIYGEEKKGRYVCEPRVYKMLDHEYGLMEDRLKEEMPDTKFFVFADTVAAINYSKTIKGNGWLGVRFQLTPQGEPNDFVLHVKMLDTNNKLQQQAIGILGVNMIFACYFYKDNIEYFIQSLRDALKNRIEIDMIRLSGPDFQDIDNRMLSLYLVKYGLTEVTMFDPYGNTVHASEWLYKKSLMVVRGHFHPPTLVTEDVFDSSFKQFLTENELEKKDAAIIAEMTLENLERNGPIEYEDFIARADMLSAMGYHVIISDCSNHVTLINYLADFKIRKLGLVIGARELLEIIENKFYQNQDGRLLVAFGELFTRNIQIYVYPVLADSRKPDELITAETLPVPEGITFLYKHLLDSHQIQSVEGYNEDHLNIFASDVFSKIADGDDTWKEMLPDEVVKVIEEKGLFL
jgi:hypothetical protein